MYRIIVGSDINKLIILMYIIMLRSVGFQHVKTIAVVVVVLVIVLVVVEVVVVVVVVVAVVILVGVVVDIVIVN